MEYKIVSSHDERELEREVNQMFDDGWEPYGSLVVKQNGHLVQPMIRFDEEDEDDEDDE